MFRNLSRATGERHGSPRLLGLGLPWLLLLIASLAALSCTGAGAGSATPLDNGAVPAASPAPATRVASATAGPAVVETVGIPASSTPASPPTRTAGVPPGPTSEATRAETASVLPSPTASPAASPTVDTVAAACPPLVLPGDLPVYGYNVLAVYPHDAGAFTQGLVYTRSLLYEGTGLTVASSVRKVDLETGEILQFYSVPTGYFGEGIAIHDDRILQLTWLNRVGFVYDLDTFDQGPISTFSYPTEGWGLTHDGTRFIMSDGTATLHFWDLQTLAETGQVEVRDEHGPVPCLNELEYIQGEVYANVWQTDYIAVIDPATGRVTAWIDLAGLLESQEMVPTADVLNGIAYDVEGDRLFVTGKYWPWLFELELVGPLQRTLVPLVGG